MQNTKSAITFGIIGGLITFLFGGWSVAVMGLFMGAGLGLLISGRLERIYQPIDASKDLFTRIILTLKSMFNSGNRALPAALTAGSVLLVFNLLQNYVVNPAIGRYVEAVNFLLAPSIVGFLLTVVFTTLTASFRGLSAKQETAARLIMLAFIVVAFPFIDKFTELRWTAQIIFALIFVILGLGLNIVVGYAGLLDLGYAAFFAIGAYTTGILSSPVHNIQMNFWLVIWIAAAVAAIFGLILGAPTLPLRGDYLAIVTLGFGEIVPVLFKNLIDVTIKEPLTCWILPLFRLQTTCITFMSHEDLTFGEKGISPIGRPSLPFIGEFESSNPVTWYFLIVILILLSVFLINRLRDSRLGRAWMAIREDELAASQMGINPVRTKLAAFAMGATFSGFAGAFYAAYIRGIFPSVFDFSASIIILSCVILGGLGSINGVLVGGLALMTADRLFLPALKDFLSAFLTHTILPSIHNPAVQLTVKDNANPILYRFLLFGLTLVIMMSVRPEGLIPNAQVRQELHAAEETPVEEEERKKAELKRQEAAK